MELTSEQSGQQDHYDQRYKNKKTAVDFDRYLKPRYGPWCPYRHVYDMISNVPNKTECRLLEIGCGDGANGLRYARMGYRVDGIDISPKGIEFARDLAIRTQLDDAATFSVQTAEALDFANEEFDIVVGVNVLHHTDTARVIAEVHRVLKNGGVAIFKEPLATPVRDRLRRNLLVTWFVPLGTKCLKKGLKYGESEGEHKLDKNDFQAFEKEFGNSEILRWRVIAKLAVFGGRQRLERIDWWAFKIFPFLRRFGDQAVLVATKTNGR